MIISLDSEHLQGSGKPVKRSTVFLRMSETNLNKQSPLSYNSFGSSHLADDSSPSDFTKKHEIHLTELGPHSRSPDLFIQKAKEADKDFSNQDEPLRIYAVLAVFTILVTSVLVLEIYFDKTLVVTKGVLASDHERCTAVGEQVLHHGGSSVDAAIAAVLCLCVVHPHASGVGGGGVMLVHDVRKNKTKVINFQGSAPRSFRVEMLQNVSELKQGLQVGVPGMLMGLHEAHSLFGSLSWEAIVSRVADVAREGFRVSHSLSDAVSKVQGEQLSQRFRDMFMPHGQVPRPGSFVKMPALAGVLEAGLSNFYNGNLSQEIVEEVQVNGGVLSGVDISNYNAEVEQPLEGRFKEFIIQVPPPPSAGAVLISVLKLLEDFHLSESDTTENQTHSLKAEALRAAAASSLNENISNSSVAELLSHILSKSQTDVHHLWMNSSHASESSNHQTEQIGGQVVVMGSDDLMVSVASSLSRVFGSRLVTPSGIILNSLLLDFSRSIKIGGQLQNDQNNSVYFKKRPEVFLMPALIIPARHKCGIHAAISSSGGQNHQEVMSQTFNAALFPHKEKNESLFIDRLQLLPNSHSWV